MTIIDALDNGTPLWVETDHRLPVVRVEWSAYIPPPVPYLPWRVLADALRVQLQDLPADIDIDCGARRCWIDLEAPTDSLPDVLDALDDTLSRPLPGLRSAWRAARQDVRTAVQEPYLVHAQGLARALWPKESPWLLEESDPRDGRPAEVRQRWRTLRQGCGQGVVVVGDLSPEAAKSMLNPVFGDLGVGPPPPPEPPPTITAQRILVHAPGADQVRVSVAWLGPARGAPDALAWEVVVEALGGGFASRLVQVLREQKGLVYDVDVSWDARVGLTLIELDAPPAQATAALDALEVELNKPRLSDAEIERAIKSYALQRQTWTETLADRAWDRGLELLYGEPPGSTYTRPLPDVPTIQAAAQRWLHQPMLWVVSGDPNVVSVLAPRFNDAWSSCYAMYGRRCP